MSWCCESRPAATLRVTAPYREASSGGGGGCRGGLCCEPGVPHGPKGEAETTCARHRWCTAPQPCLVVKTYGASWAQGRGWGWGVGVSCPRL